MTTCDPGDIHQTIQSLITHRIRCSVISLAVEVFVHRALAEATQGLLAVISLTPQTFQSQPLMLSLEVGNCPSNHRTILQIVDVRERSRS